MKILVVCQSFSILLVTKGLKPIPADFEHKVTAWTGCQSTAVLTQRQKHSHSHILYEQFRVGTLASLDCKRNWKIQKKPAHAQEEHANSAQKSTLG